MGMGFAVTDMDRSGRRSPGQMRRQVWLKWRLSDSEDVRALAAAQLAAGSGQQDDTPPQRGDDPLLAGLIALADGDFTTATTVLSDAASSGRHPECLTALADVYASRGDWRQAADLAGRAAVLRPDDPVAIVAAAATLSETDSSAALKLLWPLHTERPSDPVVSYYAVHVLLRRGVAVSSTSRDGRAVIISASQLAECRWVVTELNSLGGGDQEAAAKAAALVEQVRIAEHLTWRRQGANKGTLALFVGLSLVLLAIALGISDMAMLAGAIVLGGGTAALYVFTHRRPYWELLAQDLGSVAMRPDTV
jgi:hypothetical protein